MTTVLTLTNIPEKKFRRFARIPAYVPSKTNTLHTLSNNSEEVNLNSIRVIRNVSVPRVRDNTRHDTDKNLNDITWAENHKTERIGESSVDIGKADLSEVHADQTGRKELKLGLGDKKGSMFERVKPIKQNEFSKENRNELCKLPTLHTNSFNQIKGIISNIQTQTSNKSKSKVLKYRPATSMDNFRKDYQCNQYNKENIVEGLDVEEGNRIWDEVDEIINRSDNKSRRNSSLSERFGGNNASFVTSKDDIHAIPAECSSNLEHYMEVSTRFHNRSQKRSWRHVNRIWSYEGLQEPDTDKANCDVANCDAANCDVANCDDNKNETVTSSLDGSKNRKIRDAFPLDTEQKGVPPVGWTGLTNNIWCTDDSEPGKLYQSRTTNNSGRVSRSNSKGECKNKSVAMTTMLPRITPSSTPLPTGITQPPPRSHSSASMYVPYPPKELSSSIDFVRVPGRINPLAPPPPRRRINWSWETTDQHYENEKRSLLMQKREHTRYHSAWSKAFYGAPAEKEAYRRHYREVLKQQMSDKSAMAKEEFKQKIKETEQAISYDNNCRSNDAQEYYRKHSYLMQYRDGNKQQMEDRWAQTRNSRDLENRIDRERLRYNPINWSCSLK